MLSAHDVAAMIFGAAGIDPSARPERGSVDLLQRAFGRGMIYWMQRSPREAYVATIGGKRMIVLRRGLSTERANWLLGEMMAELVLERESTEPACDRGELTRAAAAQLVLPVSPFLAQLEEVGIDLPALAVAFCVTQTCAALRVAEVGGPPVAVATPAVVHRRGPFPAWVLDADVRRIATLRAPRSLRKVVLRDEPGRVALMMAG